MIEGIASIMFAIEYRRGLPARWGWMVASGVVDLILAGLIFAQFPSSALWAIGLLLGINMVFGGTTLIVLGARRAQAFAADLRRTHDPIGLASSFCFNGRPRLGNVGSRRTSRRPKGERWVGPVAFGFAADRLRTRISGALKRCPSFTGQDQAVPGPELPMS